MKAFTAIAYILALLLALKAKKERDEMELIWWMGAAIIMFLVLIMGNLG